MEGLSAPTAVLARNTAVLNEDSNAGTLLGNDVLKRTVMVKSAGAVAGENTSDPAANVPLYSSISTPRKEEVLVRGVGVGTPDTSVGNFAMAAATYAS